MKRTLVFAFVVCVAFAQTHSVDSRRAAENFLRSLSAAQQKAARLSFDSARRKDWHYVPRSRPGVARGQMNAAQQNALDELLRTGLSEQGMGKAKGVIELEPILGRLEGGLGFRDPERYFVAFFGSPAGSPWSWKFEGHHLSLNFTVVDGVTSATPLFLGANPARVPSGPRRGWRLLGDEEDVARQLLRSLTAAQRKVAIIATRAPGDIVTRGDAEVRIDNYEGIAASRLSASQRETLMRLIGLYVNNASAAVAARETTRLHAAGLDHLYFAWAGGNGAGQPHYYRIHGPTILIEYDNTQDGANHVHSVWRAPGADFGEDLLRKHYAEAPHHRAVINRAAP